MQYRSQCRPSAMILNAHSTVNTTSVMFDTCSAAAAAAEAEAEAEAKKAGESAAQEQQEETKR